MRYFIPIDKSSIKRNERAGESHSFVAFPTEKIVHKDGSVEIIRELMEIRHLPIPEWYYNYIPIMVECSECHEKFLNTNLLSDEDSDGCYSGTICPFCGEWGCCDIEFEDIYKVIEKGKY